MGPTVTRDVLVFAAQGSSHHLSDHATVDRLIECLGEEGNIFHLITQRCKAALYTELESLTAEEKSTLGEDFCDAFREPISLLLPPQSFSSHPVVETIALYLRQILELMLFASYQRGNHVVVETTGICTGIFPAIVASSFSSYSSEQFIDSVTENFRLAFWVGLRASMFCRHAAGESWKELPWVLSTFGLPVEEIEEKVSKYNLHGSVSNPSFKYKGPATDASKSPTLVPQPRVSAVFNQSVVSLSGPGASLHELRSTLLAPPIQCKSAQVHAFYHGGQDMQKVVEQLKSDVKRRDIRFPTWESLQVPLRSTLTGKRMNSALNSLPLLDTALRNIFVDKVDWRGTYEELFNYLGQSLSRDSQVQYQVIGLGPGAESLVGAPADMRIDPSITITGNIADFISEAGGDNIAVVGISANYPAGKGVEQFWNTLEQGKSAMSEVRLLLMKF